MRVLALCGSLREPSYTRLAMGLALAEAARAGAEVGWASLRDLPWCDGRPDDDYPPAVAELREQVKGAQALLIGSPEYHGSMTGVLKNALDLLGPAELRGKLIGLVAVARGEAGAMNTLNHLRQVGRWVDAWVLPHQVSIPSASSAFGPEGHVLRPGLDAELTQLGSELVRYARLLSAS